MGSTPVSAFVDRSEDKSLAILAYVLGWFVSFIAPLVIFFVYQQKSKFVAFHAMQALYIQGAILGLGIVMFVFSLVTVGIGLIIAIPVMIVAAIAGLTATVIGAIRANEDTMYELPVIGPMAKKSAGV